MEEICAGLRFPEGPIAMSDGSVILVEIARGTPAVSRRSVRWRWWPILAAGQTALLSGRMARFMSATMVGFHGLKLVADYIHMTGRMIIPAVVSNALT